MNAILQTVALLVLIGLGSQAQEPPVTKERVVLW